jgi:3-phosphoshikimate 1-carboxyvinyltransferase
MISATPLHSAPAAPWPAPLARRPIDATLALPGSKSLTNRALVLASLSDGPSTITAPLRARDTLLMVAALRALGVVIEDIATTSDAWQVVPSRLAGPAEIDCGLAGTLMRFVPPLAALADGVVRFDGDEQARLRPMGPMITALRDLGVTVEDSGRGALPFSVVGSSQVAGGPVTLDASGSSQFVSGLLLAGSRYERGVDVRHQGRRVPSYPHIAMTVEQLRLRGVDVDVSGPDRWVLRPGTIRAADVTVEPDLSNAAPFLAAALVTGGTVTVTGWPRHTQQAGDALRHLLGSMGAGVELGDEGLAVSGGGRILGIDADLHEVGELTPVIAALCALADGPSHLVGIAHLRGHETDRLAALSTQLNALGGDVVETADGLDIDPRPLHGGVFHTYDDHRIAHAAAVVGLAVPGIEIDDIGTTAKTHPDFPEAWLALLGGEKTPA